MLQIAVKKNLINQTSFLWWAWTDFDLGNPALFDYNDAYTAKEAGSPYAANPNYPPKALFGMDNTCRAAYGFTTTGREPGLCGALLAPTQAVVVTPLPSNPTPTRTLPPPPPPVLPGEITGIVFFDNNANGVFDAGDVGKDTYQITVYQNGSCSGSAYLGARPAPDGNYTLTDLPAGLWCLSLEYSGSPVLPSNPQTVTVAPAGDTTVNFAIQDRDNLTGKIYAQGRP
jgi:hypothetical protein